MKKPYTISEIKTALQTVKTTEDPLYQACLKDKRKGVQQLLEKWEKAKIKEVEQQAAFQKMKKYERAIRAEGFEAIAGIDEAGRGPLAGPVVAAAVILPDHFYLAGLNDSKQLTVNTREQFYAIISEQALAIGVGIVTAAEIDELNIYEATKKAMMAAVDHLVYFPDYLLLDAMKITAPIPQTSLVKGDAKSVSIAAASIIAKVTRDNLMRTYGKQYPMYHFQQNMGYGTKEHIEALRKHGPCPIHRKSFAPIKEYMMKIN
ncbi:ribonuclease HII [Bacillus chungangensis]|uniref:Ribonuclease HII n=1 Tax=Bacillus chungangensis TaxID=587633 RepID=A0ABT9WRC4_9BACI|nr:ribonuclease HII [Bacillus chungangensis]MDQ0175840.1 ribonuclease HII [Bacillus chungangensis]